MFVQITNKQSFAGEELRVGVQTVAYSVSLLNVNLARACVCVCVCVWIVRVGSIVLDIYREQVIMNSSLVMPTRDRTRT